MQVTTARRGPAAQAARENHRDFGAPAAGTWFGRGKVPTTDGIRVTLERHGRELIVRHLSGGTVDGFSVTAKFWFVPDSTPDPSVDELAAAAAAEADRQARLAAFEAEQRAAAAELNVSRRETAELLAATPTAAAPTRTTWAGAGKPKTLVWFGRDIHPGPPLVVTFNEYGNRLYDARTGQQVAHYGSDCPQWYAPVPAAPPAPTVEQPTPAPVVIVPCGSRKRPGLVRAAEKYVGPYARSARLAGEALAQRSGARVITLSARYGLLDDDDLVDDYDLTMGDPGSVTAARIAEQAARLGITDSLVTVIAGKTYADVVSAVWPHAIRALDGCTSYGNQRARMGHIARGTWSPPAPVGATAMPALFGAELVAPADVTCTAAGDLVRGDVLAPATFGAQHADPVLVIASARPVDQPDGRRRVSLIVRPLPFPGHSRHLIVWADASVDVVGRHRGAGNDSVHPPAEDAEILDGPALTWPRLLTAPELRTGDVCAPGSFGPWNKTATITVVADPVYCDTVAGVRSYDIGIRVNLRTGPGPIRHGALRADSYIAVFERPAAIDAASATEPATALKTAPAAEPVADLAPIVRGAFVSAPRALAEHAPLSADTTVVLAVSRYGRSDALHIAFWGLPTTGLCRSELVRTEAREERVNAETGLTAYRHLGVPQARAMYGYPAASTCESCRRRFAEMTRRRRRERHDHRARRARRRRPGRRRPAAHLDPRGRSRRGVVLAPAPPRVRMPPHVQTFTDPPAAAQPARR